MATYCISVINAPNLQINYIYLDKKAHLIYVETQIKLDLCLDIIEKKIMFLLEIPR